MFRQGWENNIEHYSTAKYEFFILKLHFYLQMYIFSSDAT